MDYFLLRRTNYPKIPWQPDQPGDNLHLAVDFDRTRRSGDERRLYYRGTHLPHQQEMFMDTTMSARPMNSQSISMRLNWLAAALSFGFVTAVVLGMV